MDQHGRIQINSEERLAAVRVAGQHERFHEGFQSQQWDRVGSGGDEPT